MTATESGGPRGTVRADVPATAETKAEAGERKPAWLDRFVWDALWKVVAVAFAVTVLLTLASRAQDLLRLLVISVFFALALEPAVKHMHERWGWKRGAAVPPMWNNPSFGLHSCSMPTFRNFSRCSPIVGVCNDHALDSQHAQQNPG
jgi:hypothetical protein